MHVTDESVACVCAATRGEGAVVSTYMQGRVHLRFEARAARLGRDDRVEPFGHHRARVRAQDGAREVGGCLPNGAVHEAARDDCRVGRGDEGPPCVNRQGVKRLSRRHRRQSEV